MVQIEHSRRNLRIPEGGEKLRGLTRKAGTQTQPGLATSNNRNDFAELYNDHLRFWGCLRVGMCRLKNTTISYIPKPIQNSSIIKVLGTTKMDFDIVSIESGKK